MERPTVVVGDRIHLYTNQDDLGTGIIAHGPGKSLMVQMEHGCKLSGKIKLSAIFEEYPEAEYLIINHAVNLSNPKQQNTKPKEQLEYFTKDDLANLNYLLSRGFTGSLTIKTNNLQITISVTNV